MTEQWKGVVGYEGFYAVSDYGNVHSYHRDRLMTLQRRDNKEGHLQVGLSMGGKQSFLLVHRLVAQAFIKNDLLLSDFVRHKNRDLSCNLLTNLKVSSFKVWAYEIVAVRDRKACVRKQRGRDKYVGYYYDTNSKQAGVRRLL